MLPSIAGGAYHLNAAFAAFVVASWTFMVSMIFFLPMFLSSDRQLLGTCLAIITPH